MSLTISRNALRAFQRSRFTYDFQRFSSTIANDTANIVEVGPRDGLQNEQAMIPLETKLKLIDRLAQTGLKTVEAGSFVSPQWVPQMESSSEIFAHILSSKLNPINYQFLIPNVKGLNNFLAVATPPSNVSISIFTAATETFSQKNTNCSIAKSLERFGPIFEKANEISIPVRAYVSVALGCPYEGPQVDPHKVADIAVDLLELGAYEISIGDTTGMGTAKSTKELLDVLKSAGIEMQDIALHLHDTYGQALVNAMVGLEAGVRTFDASVAGLGGCPYSPGATGNVSTEEMVYMMESVGLRTGVDLVQLSETGAWISQALERETSSPVGKAIMSQRAKA